MLICKRCGENYSPYGQKMILCRDCRREYNREYERTRPREVIEEKYRKKEERIKEQHRKVFKYLKENPCIVCGESDPIVLEFNHIDPKEKYKAVSELFGRSWETIQKEISKCNVMCANCHRRHTAQQFGWYKDVI